MVKSLNDGLGDVLEQLGGGSIPLGAISLFLQDPSPCRRQRRSFS